jgi:hypothetical protein
MIATAGDLQTFRARFEAKEPSPRNFVRRVTKFDYFLTVADLVEERLAKEFAWQGIADDLGELGLSMEIATLKTYVRRARARREAAPASAAKKPARNSPRAPQSRPSRPKKASPSGDSVAFDAATLVPPAESPLESVPPASTVTVELPVPVAELSDPTSAQAEVRDDTPSAQAEVRDDTPSAVASLLLEDALAHPASPPMAHVLPTESASSGGSREGALGGTSQEDEPPPRARTVEGSRDATSDEASVAPAVPSIRRTYRSTMNIRREKPLSEFKEI